MLLTFMHVSDGWLDVRGRQEKSRVTQQEIEKVRDVLYFPFFKNISACISFQSSCHSKLSAFNPSCHRSRDQWSVSALGCLGVEGWDVLLYNTTSGCLLLFVSSYTKMYDRQFINNMAQVSGFLRSSWQQFLAANIPDLETKTFL